MSSTRGHLLLLISGASRGLGRAVAEAFSRQSASWMSIRFVLMARSVEGLEATRQALLTRPVDTVHLQEMDFSDLSLLDARLDAVLDHERVYQESTETPADHVIFINNHGSLGHIGTSLDSPSLAEMQQNINLNVTSCLWTSVRIARFSRQVLKVPCTVVNISSLVAIQTFPTMGIYSAGKAARDSYHKAMALEQDDKDVRVLNYAPGPLETDMATELCTADQLDETLKPHFQKQLVDPADSAQALVKLVLEDAFETGSHVDYFDTLEEKTATQE